MDAPAIANHMKFHMATSFCLTLETLAKAIKTGYLTTFPSFITKQLRKYPPKIEGTQMGNLHADRIELDSTSKWSSQTNATITNLGTTQN